MPTVEIESKLLGQAVGIFLAKECVVDDSVTMRVERIDAQQEDGSSLVVTIGKGVFPFTLDGNEYVFMR